MLVSKTLARRRLRFNHARVRSTTQRLGSTSKPFAFAARLTISRSSTELVECGPQLLAGVAVIGEHVAQPRKGGTDRCQHGRSTVAVLDVCGMNGGADRRSGCVVRM